MKPLCISTLAISEHGVNRYIIDDKNVMMDKNSNIFVDGVKYERTQGLWALAMTKTPPPYAQGDLVNYRILNHQTNVMGYPQNVIECQSRPKSTNKRRNILVPLQQQEESGITGGAHANDERDAPASGEGIVQFLPGDIK